eukprot:COSAG05_NODE_14395_length_398_cov_0.652174_1_plen_106_part_01
MLPRRWQRRLNSWRWLAGGLALVCVGFVAWPHNDGGGLCQSVRGLSRGWTTWPLGPNLDILPLGYTVVISTFNRDKELLRNTEHWLSCDGVQDVQIVWHDPHRVPP